MPTEYGAISSLADFRINNGASGAKDTPSGTIPSEFGLLSKLALLIMYKSQLSGTFPEGLCAHGTLRNYQTYQSKVSGTIPTEMGQLTLMEHLRHMQTYMSGTVPTQLGRMTALKYLEFDNPTGGNRLVCAAGFESQCPSARNSLIAPLRLIAHRAVTSPQSWGCSRPVAHESMSSRATRLAGPSPANTETNFQYRGSS